MSCDRVEYTGTTGIAKLKAGNAERLLILIDIESPLEGEIGEPGSPTV